MSPKKLVLLSGGMDSVIALYHCLHEARNAGVGMVYALTFLYNQRHSTEVSAARKIVSAVMSDIRYSHYMAYHKIQALNLPHVGSLLDDVPVRKYATLDEAEKGAWEDPAFLPHRNLVFLSIAAMHARKYGCQEIVTGLRGGFSDCTLKFEREVEKVLNISDQSWRLTLSSPVHLSRADSINMAKGIPGCIEALANSVTCFEGTTPPCGECLPCRKRAEGFELASLRDPLLTPR